MKFITATVFAALFAAAQAAPAPWFWEKEWTLDMCAKATHKSDPRNPLLNDFCRLNCKNCVSMKQDCSRLTEQCNI